MTDKNTFFSLNRTINARGNILNLKIPKVMGILNITPDSFFDGGKYPDMHSIILHVEQMLVEGADMIDIGAYSSRPGAIDISVKEEEDRLIPVLKTLVKEFPQAIFSVDTFRSKIAAQAIESGAHVINDISAGELDKEMFSVIAKYKVPYIMMHMKGSPQTMTQHAQYADVLTEVMDYFISKIAILRSLGCADLIVDPGFGFAKKIEHNYTLLNNLDAFKILDVPVLAGVSRKSMLYKILDTDAEHALNATTVANTIALMKGASLLRVHDVREAKEAVRILSELHSLSPSK